MTTENKVILVTGGTGMVGSALKVVVSSEKKSKETWIFVSSKDADLTNMAQTRELFEKLRPNYVIHLAGKSGGYFSNLKYPCDYYITNVLINRNVYDASKEFNVQKLISCLATCNFPDKVSYPMDETMLHDGPPHSSVVGYSHAKRMLDVANRLYHEQFGCQFTSVISSNIFGPNDKFSIDGGHVIPGSIHKMYNAEKDQSPFTIWGTGKAVRQFIYSKDVARLIILVLREYHEIAPIILADDENQEISIKDAVSLVVKAFEFKGEIKHDLSKPDGVLKKTASNHKLRQYFPTFEFTPIEKAIQETVDWFKQNYSSARK